MKDTVLLVNNSMTHWCKLLSFHLTTLMQDALDVTGAIYEYELPN